MTLAGTWRNEYGSTMTLSVDQNSVVGRYWSTTGSTGEYLVTGWQGASEPTKIAGQPVAINIGWHSIVPGPEDPSWHWVSALGGQISLRQDSEVLELSHLMVASADYPEIVKAGVYLDKLRYHRVPEGECLSLPVNEAIPCNRDPLEGLWIADDGSQLELIIKTDIYGRFNLVSGTYTSIEGRVKLSGLSDPNAGSSGLNLQACALALLDGELAIGFGGMLNLASMSLDLQMLSNRSTSPEETYVQTRIEGKTFSKYRPGELNRAFEARQL